MNLTFDRNLFVQIGLDSGSLTMLGTIVHSFSKPGLYRGVVHEGEKVKATFTITPITAVPALNLLLTLHRSCLGRRLPLGKTAAVTSNYLQLTIFPPHLL